MTKLILQLTKSFFLLAFITGVLYPLLIWGVGLFCFPFQATGSLIKQGEVVVGSALIGQEFRDPRYFHGRPSASGGFPYNPMASGGTNLAHKNPMLMDSVAVRSFALCQQNSCVNNVPPQQLTQASASGLDPEISVEAALFQVKRIALARSIPETQIVNLVDKAKTPPLWGIFGTERIHVLKLNLALDAITR